MLKRNWDVVVVGGGAAGLVCAVEAGKRGRSVIVLEHNDHVGEKIRISGGGRCNFTNVNAGPHAYISQNPHFCKSPLARYTSADFVRMVEKHGIRFYEKKLGQLFCERSAQQIIDMLLKECGKANVSIETGVSVSSITRDGAFTLRTSQGGLECHSLVIATGGLSVPKAGATDFGYGIAKQFGIGIVAPKPGLVPFTFVGRDAGFFSTLSGVPIDAEVSSGKSRFRENILFTHRGLSGPAILQLSSYWNQGDDVIIDLLPGLDGAEFLLEQRDSATHFASVLEQHLPRKFAHQWANLHGGSKPMRQFPQKKLRAIGASLNAWHLVPTGTEGFQKAEVTVGGIDTDELSSKTMEAKRVPGLFFVGEVVDVTGWLGGYNFQWAWSSGWVAGQYA
jgi:predicted Rossmann fold flavoprotein